MEDMWLQKCIAEMNELMRQPIKAAHQGIDDRARGYSFGVAGLLQTIVLSAKHDQADPRSVILYACAFIPPKVYRALTGLARSGEDPGAWSAHHDEPAKVALIAIERSRVAWIDLAERGLARTADAERFVADLRQLADDLDRVFPKARATCS